MDTTWTFFFRHENNRVHPKTRPASYIDIELPPDTPLLDALRIARERYGMPSGTHRTGCFEVQNPLGIYVHVAENKIDLSTPRKAAKVIFKTWEQLEAED